MAEGQAWKRVLSDCFQGDALTEWKAAKERLGPSFDHAGFAAAWADYNARMQAALPLAPDAESTKTLIAEWDRLCAPYLTVVDKADRKRVMALWAFPMELDDPELFARR